jgi:hypothetical protein
LLLGSADDCDVYAAIERKIGHRFLAWCIDSQIPELLTLATTIDTWWPATTPS